MEMPEQVEGWAKRMGYKGKFPKNAKGVFNASTAHIWNQITEKVKPREEVEMIRKNILIYQMQHNIPIEDVDVWNKKSKLEMEVHKIKKHINKEEIKLKHLVDDNKVLELQKINLEQKIKENREKTYLYEKKSDEIKNQISSVEPKLTYCSNVNFVKTKNSNNSNIVEDLKSCSEKLRALIEEKETPLLYRSIYLVNQSDSLGLNLSESEKNEMLDFLKDKKLQDEVESILNKYDLGSLWNTIRKFEECSKKFLSDIFASAPIYFNDNHNMSQLYAIHVKNELTARKCNLRIQELNNFIRIKKETLISESNSELKAMMHLKLKKICYHTIISSMGKALENLDVNDDAEYETQRKLQKSIMAEIKNKIHKIFLNLELFVFALKNILAVRKDTIAHIKKLPHFFDDLLRFQPLTNAINYNEVKVFRNFCLEFNRKCYYTSKGSKILLTNFTRSIPHCETDFDNALRLCMLLDNPLTEFPEAVLLSLMQQKIQLRKLKTLKSLPTVYQRKACSYKQLANQESHINFTIDKLCYIMQNCDCKKYISEIRGTDDVWEGIPFTDYAGGHKLFMGQNCRHYQELYDSYYNKM